MCATEDKKVTVFFFVQFKVNLDIPEYESCSLSRDNNVEPITNIIKEYKEHLSSVVIKNSFPHQLSN